MSELLKIINRAFAANPAAASGNLFVSYEQNDAVTGSVSSICDQRIVWGGDETVNRIRAIPLNPHAGERSFASKRSLSVFSLRAYMDANPDERARLADAMAVDIVPFAQMACSSPHTIVWVGSLKNWRDLMAAFSSDVEQAFARRSGIPDLGLAVRRFNAACSAAAHGKAASITVAPHTTHYVANRLEDAEQEDPCGAGLLVHANCASLSELSATIQAYHQTITHYGLSEEELKSLAESAGRAGADRVVPIGKALGFSAIWDGFNLWADLTRTVDVQT